MKTRLLSLVGQNVRVELNNGRTGVTTIRKVNEDGTFDHAPVMAELAEGTICGRTMVAEVREVKPWGPLHDPYPTLEAKLRALINRSERAVRVFLKDGTNFVCTVEDCVSATAFCHEQVQVRGDEVTKGGVTWFTQVERVELRFRPFERNAVMQEMLTALLPVKDRDIRVYLKNGSVFVCSVEDRVTDTAFCHEEVQVRGGEVTKGGVTWFEQVDRIELRFRPFEPNPGMQAMLLAVLGRQDRLIRVRLKDGTAFVCTVEDHVSPTAFCHEEVPGSSETTRGGVTWFEQVALLEDLGNSD